jgi:hypothetical protein
MKPSWIPTPLDPDHAERLQAWARTLPGRIHNPWKREMIEAQNTGAAKGGQAMHRAKLSRQQEREAFWNGPEAPKL